MSLISAGSISLDSTFNKNFARHARALDKEIEKEAHHVHISHRNKIAVASNT
jgi:hypothetical protein